MKSSVNNISLLIVLLTIIAGCATQTLQVPVVSKSSTYINGLNISDIVKLSFQKNKTSSRSKVNDKMCGYELTNSVWNLKFTQAINEHETVNCRIQEGKYILLELISSHNIMMNQGGEDDCDLLAGWALRDVDRLHDPDLWIDGLYISDLSPFRQKVQGCPTPFLQGDSTFAGHRSNADGYFILIDPMGPSMHRITFSVTDPCWLDLRDINTGECPHKESRRVVEMFLTIGGE